MFPYDYSAEKLLEAKLPNKEQFNNKLHDDAVDGLKYEHAIKVGNSFIITSLQQNF